MGSKCSRDNVFVLCSGAHVCVCVCFQARSGDPLRVIQQRARKVLGRRADPVKAEWLGEPAEKKAGTSSVAAELVVKVGRCGRSRLSRFRVADGRGRTAWQTPCAEEGGASSEELTMPFSGRCWVEHFAHKGLV